jgi:hypothetical protein
MQTEETEYTNSSETHTDMDKTMYQVIPPINKERYVIIFIQVNTNLPKSYLLDWKLGASKQVLLRGSTGRR